MIVRPIALILAVLIGCSPDPESQTSVPASRVVAMPALPFTAEERETILTLSPLPPAPPDPTNAVADDPAAARLGRFLFFDTRLSADGTVSCATCHDPALAFTDGRQLGKGLAELTRHTMGLANVAHNRWLFWDGRADTLWTQALGPIEDEREHGTSRVHVARVMHDDPATRAAYESRFGSLPPLDDRTRFPADARPVPDNLAHPDHRAWMAMSVADRAAIDRVFANVGKAIAAYERLLRSDRSPFDRFVEGLRHGDAADLAALPVDAQRGLRLFIGRASCTLCHFGPNFTDGEFHSTGVPPLAGGELFDTGRYDGILRLESNPFNAAGPHSDASGPSAAAAVSKVRSVVRSPESWGQFKTPSLRDVARTAPYMHEGQFETLERVVAHYSTLEGAVLPSHHQEQLLVPLNLTERERSDIVAFLVHLSSDPLPSDLLTRPEDPRYRTAP